MGYGQTGSGKSFTMSGLRNNWEHRGLVPRLLTQMFAEKAKRKKINKIEYCISFIEIYGKETKDLLLSTDNNKVKINEREPFKEISMIPVDNENECLKKIFEGEIRRSIAIGSTYPASHLSMSVITFHVSNLSLITSWGIVTTAKIHIVETAGTGTVGKNSCWKTATDIGMANLMKTQLEQFFSHIESPATINISRSNNLFKILGNAFSVSSIIRFISHIRITEEDLDITLSTLRLTAKINEVNALKKELMLNNLILNQEALMNISKSRMEQINRSIFNFLNDKISDFTLFR
ncbi:kinesin-II 85 kDa subunit-like [Apis dorsata]|uniref:kinesin-II 85 kDa subunit-like n=1 Tax=Apis dorsata TaxID=7462 RepID=UPI001293AFE1|nr:kinesin-II 85 kDa subunit-like [Apis dorsata]